MSHIVVYQTDDGSSGFEQCGNLDDAIVVAERLRNVDGVENPRIFRMEEVHIDFRPYYRVEVAEPASDHEVGTGEEGAVSSSLGDPPAPPSPEGVAEAEAETGAQMSSASPAWADRHDANADHDAGEDQDVPEPAEHADEAGQAEEPMAPVAETEPHSGSGDDSGIEESAEDADSGDDAMISVRRGLFGR